MFFKKQPLFYVESPYSECFKAWADHQHSLTERLVQLRGSSQLEVLFQNWIKPNWWDTYFLQINDELIYQREIIMRHNNTEYWYARTVIPETCYEAAPTFFDRLNSESIKNLIFGESRVHCTNRICYPIDDQCVEFYWAKKYLPDTKGTLWCRLAEYQFEHKASFYLVELLLPELGAVT